MLALRLHDHPHGPLLDLRRKLACSLHGSILSKVGASSKPGAVQAFYEGCLGLKAGNFKPDGKLEYAVGGTTLALFPKPDGTKAEHTAISFRVDDIAASVANLKQAGVVFEDYDLPGFKTVDAKTAISAAVFDTVEVRGECVVRPNE